MLEQLERQAENVRREVVILSLLQLRVEDNIKGNRGHFTSV